MAAFFVHNKRWNVLIYTGKLTRKDMLIMIMIREFIQVLQSLGQQIPGLGDIFSALFATVGCVCAASIIVLLTVNYRNILKEE
ncbi:MAG: hypothetical protein IJZ68_09115 [Bacteroidaceae bacterium]|nr:hypothetical protein [Bacteroidaceae bacterium]